MSEPMNKGAQAYSKETRCPDCGYRVLFWSDRELAVCGNCQCRFNPLRKVVKT